MGFFFADTKAAAPKAKPKQRLADIPVASLRRMGCSVCPRDKDHDRLDTPKLRAHGRGSDVLILWAAPTVWDDREGQMMSDKAGREVERALGRRFVDRHCSFGAVLQCAGDAAPTAAEVECCRPRGVEDVEAIRPLLILTVGDEAMRWALGMQSGTAIPHRGTLFVARIGKHACWVMPLLYPNYVNKQQQFGGDGGEWRLALDHDCRRARQLIEREELPDPRPEAGPYDRGIEYVTGRAAGDMQRLDDALQDLAGAPRGALDIETNGLRPFMLKTPQILTAAVGTFERTLAFALDHPDGWGSAHQRDRARRLFYAYLQASGRKACHNLAFEMEWLAADGAAGLLRRTEWDDTMASAHTLDERPGTKALEVQTQIYFGFNLKAQSNVDPARLMDYPIQDVLRYNGMDTKWTNAVRDAHAPLLDAEPGFRDLYERKVTLAPALVLMTAKGLPVDQEFADGAVRRLRGEIDEIEGRLQRDPSVREYVRRHGTFSPTNPDHLLRLLKDLNRDEVNVLNKRDGTVKESTAEDILVAIGSDVPACGLVLEHRSVSKLEGTYVGPTARGENVCPDGMIRSAYKSMTTVTDRLSSDDPAVQNWPKRKHKWVRAMVSVRPVERRTGRRHWFVALDYGQIEFRVVGMASEDPVLVKYCWTGYDVHKAWAVRLVELFPGIKDWVVREIGVDWDEGGIKALRQEMKNKWVFPQLFGSSLRSCAASLQLPEDVAEEMGAEFWDEFQGVKRWHKRVLDGYARNLYVETLNGTRRRGPMSPNEAINMPIQGTAAAIVKEATTALSEEAELRDDPELQPALNIHDDLSTILTDETMEGKMDTMARIMCEHRFDFINVPLIVEASIGPNWADLEEVRKYSSEQLFGLRNPYV